MYGVFIMKIVEEKNVVNEIVKGLNWKEKIITKTFKKTCIKLYRKGMIDLLNK